MKPRKLKIAAEASKPAAASKGRKSVASLLRLTHRLYSRALLAAIQERGVTTIVQWWILRSLWLEDGLTQRELSERIGLYESAIVSVLDTLTKNGFIVRARNRDDRRKINVHLTKAGRALERDLLPLADGVNRIAETRIDDTARESLWMTLSVLYENLDEHVAKRIGAKSKPLKAPIPR